MFQEKILDLGILGNLVRRLIWVKRRENFGELFPDVL